eukprot:CAMPEP_0171011934 /NCGR_PEP_ID=MMETSP0736-20130129/23219_1 /TAXON_ID=186038 /ORGANISM="Fragilariopsis kerguelensis, Strain L26-C5" /LENGTH=56 /DNA_ID=CAMNT_0011444847 /DNA_START=195 /DNA_END=365 /DNA_ORIENTATION=-
MGSGGGGGGGDAGSPYSTPTVVCDEKVEDAGDVGVGGSASAGVPSIGRIGGGTVSL